jgi:UDP:flavonoid glycosyltransferase YjiC (YdhE family)
MTTLRRELGLPPLLNPIFDHHSPHGTLALFSSVLATPQLDWFPNTTLTGFPFYEEGTLSAELEDFLRPLDAPLLFTLGSAAVETAGTFWERSVQVAQSLNRRAILLVGKRPVGVPSSLPLGILAVPYAPHALLMPRCAAIIHQGGVGTTGQALRSGRPQLVVPFAHDQPDNATRVVRLGCGLSLPIGSYTTATAFKRLRWLLGNDAYATRARAVGDQVASENGAERAAKEITSFLRV